MESSNTVVIPSIVIKAVNLNEQLTNMKAILYKLLKESVENDAQINRQKKKIADLTRKSGKWQFETLTKA